MPIKLERKARTLAKATGVDKLGQSTLKKLDKNGDGVVSLRDVQKLVRSAGLEKDGVLSRADRASIKDVLGGEPTSSSTRSRGQSSLVSTRIRSSGGGGESSSVPSRGGGGESGGGWTGGGGGYVGGGGE